MRYEAVWRQAIQKRHSLENGWELALLVRRGVVAWMRAWPTVDEAPLLDDHIETQADESQATPITIPSSACEEVTSVLVSMILPQRTSPFAAVP
ncbi:MAG: hypothetical protein ABGW87_14205 [Sphingomonadaceae bacterium]|nr:hypothetical protein [Fuerstiella sp.]